MRPFPRIWAAKMALGTQEVKAGITEWGLPPAALSATGLSCGRLGRSTSIPPRPRCACIDARPLSFSESYIELNLRPALGPCLAMALQAIELAQSCVATT